MRTSTQLMPFLIKNGASMISDVIVSTLFTTIFLKISALSSCQCENIILQKPSIKLTYIVGLFLNQCLHILLLTILPWVLVAFPLDFSKQAVYSDNIISSWNFCLLSSAFPLDRRNSPPNSLTPCLKIRNMFDPVM